MKNKGVFTGILKMIWLLPLILFSCKKESQKPIYLTDAIKNSFNYQPGTYWVFFDSLSGHTDSFAVVRNTNLKPFVANPTGATEIIKMDVNAYDHGFSTGLSLYLELGAPSSMGTIHDGYSSAIFYDYPWDLHETRLSYTCDLLQSYSVVGVTYDSIYKVTNSVDSGTRFSKLYWHDTYLISPKEGFVAIMYNNSSTKANLTMVRHKIVK